MLCYRLLSVFLLWYRDSWVSTLRWVLLPTHFCVNSGLFYFKPLKTNCSWVAIWDLTFGMWLQSVWFRGQSQKSFLTWSILLNVVVVVNDVIFRVCPIGAQIFVDIFFYYLSSVFRHLFESVSKVLYDGNGCSWTVTVFSYFGGMCQKLGIFLHFLFILGWIDQLICSNKPHLLLLSCLVNQFDEMFFLSWVALIAML